MFLRLVESGHPALEPLIVTKDSILSLKRECLFDPKAIFALFYIHGFVKLYLLYQIIIITTNNNFRHKVSITLYSGKSMFVLYL